MRAAVQMPRWTDLHPLVIRADRPKVTTVRCTYVGAFSKAQCLMESQPGSDRCGIKGHGL